MKKMVIFHSYVSLPEGKPPVHPQVHREKDLQHRDADRPVAPGLVAHDPEVQELSAKGGGESMALSGT